MRPCSFCGRVIDGVPALPKKIRNPGSRANETARWIVYLDRECREDAGLGAQWTTSRELTEVPRSRLFSRHQRNSEAGERRFATAQPSSASMKIADPSPRRRIDTQVRHEG